MSNPLFSSGLGQVLADPAMLQLYSPSQQCKAQISHFSGSELSSPQFMVVLFMEMVSLYHIKC